MEGDEGMRRWREGVKKGGNEAGEERGNEAGEEGKKEKKGEKGSWGVWRKVRREKDAKT